VQQGKDYYGILGLLPGATQHDVKRSFRKLALKYHPDKQGGGNVDTNATYANIQEAYGVLSNAKMRQAYLQERWLLRAQGKPLGKTEPMTPQTIFAQLKTFQQTLANTDHYRMHHARMAHQLLEALQQDHLELLARAGNNTVNERIFECALKSTEPIDYKYLTAVFLQLEQLAVLCNTQAQCYSYLKKRRQTYWWQKNQYWIIGLATVAICAFMFLA
jgi:curved DNA-binding protein CbpA